MSLSVTIDSVAIADAIAPSSVAAQSIARGGDVGFGGFEIDDPGADITTTGHKWVTIEESECAQPRLFTGLITDRDMGRSDDRGMIVADDRLHDATLVDLNAVFSLRIITYAGGNRPAETMAERLTWLLGYQALVNLIEDTGFVDWDILTLGMDEADYTGSTPKGVLDDLIGRRPNITYFAFWDADEEAVSLYFGGDSAGIGESTLAISNDITDINGTTIFPPDSEAKLKRSPEEVYSEVQVNYARGTKRTYRKRGSISTEFIARGTVIDRPYTMSKATAQAQAETFLDMHSKEQDTITCTVLLPPESAGLIVAGQRIDVKFLHLDDYTDWTSMRVTSVNVRPANDVANRYFLDLELTMPVVADTPPVPTCAVAVDSALYGITPTYSASAGITGVPSDLERTTDGGMQDYSVWGIELAGAGTWVRDYIWTLPSPIAVSAVTVSAQWWGMGIGNIPEALEKFTVILNSTPYDHTYATGEDRDVWTYMDEQPPGPADFHYDKIATWRMGAWIPNVSTITLRCTEVHGGLLALKPLRMTEIAVCDGGTTQDDEEDLGQTSGSTVTRELVTPQPDGTETEFATSQPYVTGSLVVFVDGLAVVSSEVIETGGVGFTLTWAPDADERVEASYTVA